jgi:ribonuclease T2
MNNVSAWTKQIASSPLWSRHLCALALMGMMIASNLHPAMAQGGKRGGTPGEFDFYVLALSWSPGFCELEGDRKGRDQCAAGAGLDFVVHGLWPQFERGYPSECGTERNPTALAMREAKGVFPSDGLARHEWRKHGTCSGLSPADYFAATRKARQMVQVPGRFKDLQATITLQPLEIERAFVEANRGLRTDMLSVACRKGVLQEVRICFDRDLKGFRSCPEVDRSQCRAFEVTLPALR